METVWKKLRKISNNEITVLSVWNLCGKTKENDDISKPKKNNDYSKILTKIIFKSKGREQQTLSFL